MLSAEVSALRRQVELLTERLGRPPPGWRPSADVVDDG
jgi:hypothetical protein